MFRSQTANRDVWRITVRKKVTTLELSFFLFLDFRLSFSVMQSISIRLPCVMHGGDVIRPAVADVHIKINAPLAMRNFHPSRTVEKALAASVSLKIRTAKAGRPAGQRGICITNTQTASNEIHQSVLRHMNGRALNRDHGHMRVRVCVSVRTCVRRVDAPSERMRPNHSINPVLYNPLDAILFNKANAAYGPAMAATAPSLSPSPRCGPAENQLTPCVVLLSTLQLKL